MKTKLAILCWLTAGLCPLANAQGTAFTYQGRLNDGANPATGIYDLRFTLHNASSGGAQQGGPLTNSATAVGNGLFTVTLDFGTGIFAGAERWLEIGVRSNGVGAFVVLTPRQAVTATPYAIYAKGASASGLTGTLPSTILNGIYVNPLTLNNGANSFSGSFYGQFFGTSFTGGSFTGDGSGLLNLNASQISEGSFPASSLANAWRIIGNSGTTATNFIGTTENHALDFRVTNVRGFRIEPDPRGGDAANLIGGHPLNRIEQPNSGGSTIGGGGGGGGGENIIRSNSSGAFIGAGSLNALGPNASDGVIAGGKGNRVASYAAVIGGGFGNNLQTNSAYSTIAGGSQNMLRSESATIGGGVGNANTGYAATVAGGFFNTAANNGAFVGGGGVNVASGFNSTVTGGAENYANEANAVIGGGYHNTNHSVSATIAGGAINQIGVFSFNATIGGGIHNVIQTDSGSSTISGGIENRIGASAFNSFIGGGSFNEILANSPHGTIPGGEYNAATTHAFAAGRQAKANHTGAFVWSDSTGIDFPSVANNEFAVRAGGGVRFVTTGAGMTLNGQPVLTTGSTDAVTLNNPANAISGTFTGSGAGLTSLNSSNLVGTLGDARLSANVALRTGGNTFSGDQILSSGTFSGNGSGLNNLNITNLVGTLADARLSANVALRAGGNTFTGNQAVTSGNVSIGTTSPSARLHVGGGNRFTVSDVGSIFLQSGTGGSGAARDWKMYVPMTAGNLAFRDMGFDNLNNGMAGDAMVIQPVTGNVGINTTNPTAILHVGGIPGTDGIRFPNGTLQTTAPVPVFASGSGLNPTTTNQFLAQPVTVTVNSTNQRILVTSHKALGSVAVGGATNLNLYISYRSAGSGVGPTTVGGGILGNRVAQNTRITMGLSAMVTGLPPGNYEVGLSGNAADPANWNNNEYSYTTATVY